MKENEYDLILNADVNSSSRQQWFYFRLSGSAIRSSVTYTFNIINMEKQRSLSNEGDGSCDSICAYHSMFASMLMSWNCMKQECSQWYSLSVNACWQGKQVGCEVERPSVTIATIFGEGQIYPTGAFLSIWHFLLTTTFATSLTTTP